MLYLNEWLKIQDDRQSCQMIVATKIVAVTATLSTILKQLVLPLTCQNKLFLTLVYVFMANKDVNGGMFLVTRLLQD